MKTDFQLLAGDDPQDFADRVHKQIGDGWTIAGFSTCFNGEKIVFSAALTRPAVPVPAPGKLSS